MELLVPTRLAVLFWDKCPFLGRKCHRLGRLLRILREVNEGHSRVRCDANEQSFRREKVWGQTASGIRRC